jgi:hypothetical protein
VTRAAVYIDGFNLYHGLKAGHGRKYLWLDLEAVTADCCAQARRWTWRTTSRRAFATTCSPWLDSTPIWAPYALSHECT